MGMEKGPLHMTADDHIAIGSGPAKLLIDNPGKCRADFLDRDQLSKWLSEQRGSLDWEIESSEIPKTVKVNLLREHTADLKYLEMTGRLPDEYRKDIARYESVLASIHPP